MNTAAKIVSILIGIVLFYSLVGCGEDEQMLTGTWVGEKFTPPEAETDKWTVISLEEKIMNLELRLAQDGAIITGRYKYGLEKECYGSIQDGVFDGTTLTFIAKSESDCPSAEVIGKLSGDTLSGKWGEYDWTAKKED